MSRILGILLFVFAFSTHITADLCLWSGDSGNVSITGTSAVINAAGTYKFEAVTTCGSSNTLANIGNITIDSSVTGTVTVYIESRSDNNTPGAANVGSINLTNTSGVTGDLAELRITGDLGTPSVASEVTAITGVATVGGDLVREFKSGSLSGTFTAGSIDETFKVTGTHAGAITVSTITQTGNIWLSGAGTHTGSVTVTGECRGSLLAGTSGTSATVSGDWTVGGDLTGNIRICGTMNGVIDIGETVNQAADVPSRPIYISTLNNVVRNRESLQPDPGTPGGTHDRDCDTDYTGSLRTVWIGAMGDDGAVVIDWDDWDPGHNWNASAIIHKESADYTDHTPAEKLYRVTYCLGDMNNDGVLNSFDTDPFVEALTDPSGFDENYPPHAGSRVDHADCDCSGTVTNDDIDAYTELLFEGEGEGCFLCEGGGGGGMRNPVFDDPFIVAVHDRDHVDSIRFASLYNLIAGVAETHADGERRAFWTEVLGYLSE
ncbi:MAG: hypothetical protein AB7Q17_17055 [Phycisphaerae bacterium]